ncbi:MAG: hypothetical protein RJA07_220 [Bacteroidota bacterium]|jgi:hypothetical protein
MKGQELNNEIERQLIEFETLQCGELNQDWRTSLMKKIEAKENVRSNSFQSSVFAFSIIVLAINALVILKTFSSKQNEQLSHADELKAIQKELLINENLSNN